MIQYYSSNLYRFPINLYFVNIQANQINIITILNAINNSKNLLHF